MLCSTPDYITPNEAPIPKTLDCNEVNFCVDKYSWIGDLRSVKALVLIVCMFLQEDACPKSPEKIKTVKAKKQMQSKIYNKVSYLRLWSYAGINIFHLLCWGYASLFTSMLCYVKKIINDENIFLANQFLLSIEVM